MKILGLDVCKNSVVAWELTSLPKNFRSYFRDNKRPKDNDPLTFKANADGVSKLLALKPDAIILEPTGVHYSWIWAHICETENIRVLWVGHAEATHYRKQNKLPDKNDQADALALAAYALLHWGDDEFFLQFEAGRVALMRHLWLQLQSLNRIQSPIINRARQQLAREFPEAALSKSEPSKVDGLPPLWAWLAGRERSLKRQNTHYDRLYRDSIANQYNVGITTFTRKLSNLLCDLADWEGEIQTEVLEILNFPEFIPYRKVMTMFGIGVRPQALLISQIYPVTKFDSVGRFKRRLGMAKDEYSSGDKETMNTGAGSKLCRSQLYLWVLDQIAPVHARPNNEIGRKLGEFYDSRKSQFQDNPELWKQKAVTRLQQVALKEFKRSLSQNLIPIVSKELQPQLEATLNLTLQTMQMSLVTSIAAGDIAPGVKHKDVKRGFGNLVISQTAAYGCRLLFKELKRAVTNDYK
ncbi:IS110 family transposase [Anabaena azotica]|uniref:Transposase n=1 Tax=Anabaena azotica FACHB-119 TaxID=947527 RepID=A0ABR8DBP8_9NOST|nr:transposase [Anabaena azotica]MBD2503153.1 transposase [Anabaena azotica FACHB-119]